MKKDSPLEKTDLEQVIAHGLTGEEVCAQIDIFKKGPTFVKLKRPATVGDGIVQISNEELRRLSNLFSQAVSEGRCSKFVPASGAASRMFASLLSFQNQDGKLSKSEMAALAKKGDREAGELLEFLNGIQQFAFYEDLKSKLSRSGLEINRLLAEGEYKEVLKYLLTEKGMNYVNLPKALIKFHRYGENSRTPLEEHLEEAVEYIQDRSKCSRIHFTVSPEHENAVKTLVRDIEKRWAASKGTKFKVSLSIQKPSTDTLAVDLENRPFRDADGKLIFRPGGHGALLQNLNELEGDIVFVKNIDNVACAPLNRDFLVYKRALGGLLVDLQEKVFDYLRKLHLKKVDTQLLDEIFEFLKEKLFIEPPPNLQTKPAGEKVKFLISKLNRPMRVCGMVKNEGEPGGGPFWVADKFGGLSLQIVEASEVNPKSTRDQKVFRSSTHFNPVDLVCGVRDFNDKPFNLFDFRDDSAVFISVKSKDGKPLKALEHPGLWNGGMAFWNTVFVEVPIFTFNPVKTVSDLLRPEHQCMAR